MLRKKFKLGDGSSWDYASIFMECYGSLALYAARYVGPEEGMSVVHDVFMALWERGREFGDRESVRRYLYAAVRNRALNHMRHDRAARNYQKTFVGESDGYRDRLFFIEEETMRLLAAEVDKLPVHQREVILLALDNKSNSEIAELLGISVDTVKFHKKNAYKLLRDKLADSYFLSFLL